MKTLTRGRATHSDKLEKWLGAEQVKYVSDNMHNFYYPIQAKPHY